jgi:excisionase family DNA binding protein
MVCAFRSFGRISTTFSSEAHMPTLALTPEPSSSNGPTGCTCRDKAHVATHTAAQAPASWMNPDPLWQVPEFATYLGIKPEFARQLVKQRRIETVKIGGRVLIRKSTADAIIARGTRPATGPLNTDRFNNWQ